jgi:hypothetical protein
VRSTLLSTQSRSWARGRAAPRPRFVSSYSTLAGTAAKTVRVTNPYSSSRRNVRVSRHRDPEWNPAQDPPRVIITISLPGGTDTQIKLTSLDTTPGPGTGT